MQFNPVLRVLNVQQYVGIDTCPTFSVLLLITNKINRTFASVRHNNHLLQLLPITDFRYKRQNANSEALRLVFMTLKF